MNPVVFNTVNTMLRDRGYTRVETSPDELADLRIVACNPGNPDDRVMVAFLTDPKVSVKQIKSIRDTIENDERPFTCLILVYKTSITVFAKQFIATDTNLTVQIFAEHELAFNITKHYLVPKHELLSPADRAAVIKTYRTNPKHFPLMSVDDPVARYFGATPGQMFRITRPSPTAGQYTLYRVVC